MQVHQKGVLLIVSMIHIYINMLPSLLVSGRDSGQRVILTIDEGDISDITYSPGIEKSDHIMLQFYLYTDIRKHYATREYRLFDKADYSEMREMMLIINWAYELQCKSPQEAMDGFHCARDSVKLYIYESTLRVPFIIQYNQYLFQPH